MHWRQRSYAGHAAIVAVKPVITGINSGQTPILVILKIDVFIIPYFQDSYRRWTTLHRVSQKLRQERKRMIRRQRSSVCDDMIRYHGRVLRLNRPRDDLVNIRLSIAIVFISQWQNASAISFHIYCQSIAVNFGNNHYRHCIERREAARCQRRTVSAWRS
jgi:hypothetical protein